MSHFYKRDQVEGNDARQPGEGAGCQQERTSEQSSQMASSVNTVTTQRREMG